MNMAATEPHAYTLRLSEAEFADISRIANEQGIPISRVIRIGLLYFYAHLGDRRAFEGVLGLSSLLKGKVADDVEKIRLPVR